MRRPLSLRNVEDLLFERGFDIFHETARIWWNRFGPMFAADIRRQRFRRMKSLQNFAPVHASFHNHFNSERHLIDRQTYKTRRSSALAEWQNLMA